MPQDSIALFFIPQGTSGYTLDRFKERIEGLYPRGLGTSVKWRIYGDASQLYCCFEGLIHRNQIIAFYRAIIKSCQVCDPPIEFLGVIDDEIVGVLLETVEAILQDFNEHSLACVDRYVFLLKQAYETDISIKISALNQLNQEQKESELAVQKSLHAKLIKVERELNKKNRAYYFCNTLHAEIVKRLPIEIWVDMGAQIFFDRAQEAIKMQCELDDALSPRTTSLSPRTTSLSPRTTSLSPRTPSLSPRRMAGSGPQQVWADNLLLPDPAIRRDDNKVRRDDSSVARRDSVSLRGDSSVIRSDSYHKLFFCLAAFLITLSIIILAVYLSGAAAVFMPQVLLSTLPFLAGLLLILGLCVLVHALSMPASLKGYSLLANDSIDSTSSPKPSLELMAPRPTLNVHKRLESEVELETVSSSTRNVHVHINSVSLANERYL